MMIATTVIVAFLVGAVLAQRFRILILLPLLALAVLAAIVAVFATGADLWHFPLIAGIGLQLGYLAGAAFRTWRPFANGKAEASSVTDKPKPSAGAFPVH